MLLQPPRLAPQVLCTIKSSSNTLVNQTTVLSHTHRSHFTTHQVAVVVLVHLGCPQAACEVDVRHPVGGDAHTHHLLKLLISCRRSFNCGEALCRSNMRCTHVIHIRHAAGMRTQSDTRGHATLGCGCSSVHPSDARCKHSADAEGKIWAGGSCSGCSSCADEKLSWMMQPCHAPGYTWVSSGMLHNAHRSRVLQPGPACCLLVLGAKSCAACRMFMFSW